MALTWSGCRPLRGMENGLFFEPGRLCLLAGKHVSSVQAVRPADQLLHDSANLRAPTASMPVGVARAIAALRRSCTRALRASCWCWTLLALSMALSLLQ